MSNPTCPFCHAATEQFLRGRPDHEFGIPVQLSYHRCNACASVFAQPIPVESIGSFYASYSTHGQLNTGKRPLVARAARHLALREFTAASNASGDEPVLDYGCGDGSFLTELRDAGYTNLTGYDFDPQAREAARSSNAFIVDRQEDLAGRGPFATITLNHVIEHMVDPARDLAWLGSLLKPQGRLIVRTPNARSMLSALFGQDWRGWETPRHLHVFTPAGMRAFAGLHELRTLHLMRLFTSQAMYLGIFHESLRQPAWKQMPGKLLRHGAAFASLALMSLANRVAPVGEELVAVFERR